MQHCRSLFRTVPRHTLCRSISSRKAPLPLMPPPPPPEPKGDGKVVAVARASALALAVFIGYRQFSVCSSRRLPCRRRAVPAFNPPTRMCTQLIRPLLSLHRVQPISSGPTSPSEGVCQRNQPQCTHALAARMRGLVAPSAFHESSPSEGRHIHECGGAQIKHGVHKILTTFRNAEVAELQRDNSRCQPHCLLKTLRALSVSTPRTTFLHRHKILCPVPCAQAFLCPAPCPASSDLFLKIRRGREPVPFQLAKRILIASIRRPEDVYVFQVGSSLVAGVRS